MISGHPGLFFIHKALNIYISILYRGDFMAKDNKKILRANRNIQNIAKGISGNMEELYRSTYMTSPQQSSDLQDLNNRINDSIDNIVNRNMETMGIPSVSKLYSRMAASSSSNDMINELERMFDNGIISDDLYGMFTSNRYLKELDAEIDTVCKYMPKLDEALQVQRDCVLSADHFSKDFLSFTNPGTEDETVFVERVKDVKLKYDLNRLVDEIYMDTSKYGEQFVYRIPYSIAIGKLLATKPDSQLVPPSTHFGESVGADTPRNECFALSLTSSGMKIYSEAKDEVVSESGTMMVEDHHKIGSKEVSKFIERSILKENESFRINIEICRSGIIESAVSGAKEAFEKRSRYKSKSLSNMHEQKILREASKNDIEAKGNINIGTSRKDTRIISNDGLVTGDAPEIVKVSAPGCVIKKLPREQVIPIYIDDICMGYYYFELKTTDTSESFMGFKNILGDPLTNMKGDTRNAFNSVDNKRQDETIRYVAGQLSNFIDKQFVNNNQDLAKEIYMILKYNDLFNTPSVDLIKVTFIPPEDMVHFFFRQDPVTRRGISDLDKGLVPAKIYSSLYITSAIATLTRGQDKRVYYVKQTVDTNIAQTLLNTIAQIKQSNFGIRQFQNINNVLNITGRFNDYIIPVNASGDQPIQFEIMPGQDVNVPTDLMEQLQEMAINSTGIPIEIIQARQSIDYAMQLTMSSSKVLRFCYKRQELYQDLLSRLISPIYNYEYDENVIIKITLPPPSFINITNTNQLIDNTKGFVQSIAEVELADEQNEKIRSIYTRELFKHYIGTHLDISTHKNILERAKILAGQETDESHDDSGSLSY